MPRPRRRVLRHEARKRASLCSHSPMGALLAIVRPGLREAVVRHLLGFDAERILDDRAVAGRRWSRAVICWRDPKPGRSLVPLRDAFRHSVAGPLGPASTQRDEARRALNYAMQLLGKGYSEVVIVDLAEGGQAYAPADFARFYLGNNRDSS
jgi:hypothetical protein